MRRPRKTIAGFLFGVKRAGRKPGEKIFDLVIYLAVVALLVTIGVGMFSNSPINRGKTGSKSEKNARHSTPLPDNFAQLPLEERVKVLKGRATEREKPNDTEFEQPAYLSWFQLEGTQLPPMANLYIIGIIVIVALKVLRKVVGYQAKVIRSKRKNQYEEQPTRRKRLP